MAQMASAAIVHDLRVDLEQLMTAHLQSLFAKLEARLLVAMGGDAVSPMASQPSLSEKSARSPNIRRGPIHQLGDTTTEESPSPNRRLNEDLFSERPQANGVDIASSASPARQPGNQCRDFKVESGSLQQPLTWEVVPSSVRAGLPTSSEVKDMASSGYKPVSTKEESVGAPHMTLEPLEQTSPRLDSATLVLLAISTAVEAFDVDFRATHHIERSTLLLFALKLALGLGFLLELIVRVHTKGPSFFAIGARHSGWRWLQISLVVLQVIELTLKSGYRWLGLTFGGLALYADTMALVGNLRVLRILHVVERLEIGAELHILLTSLSGSMKSLGWSVVFMIVPILVYAMIITEAVSKYTAIVSEESVQPESADR